MGRAACILDSENLHVGPVYIGSEFTFFLRGLAMSLGWLFPDRVYVHERTRDWFESYTYTLSTLSWTRFRIGARVYSTLSVGLDLGLVRSYTLRV